MTLRRWSSTSTGSATAPRPSRSVSTDWPESEHRYAELVAERFGLEHHSRMLGPESLELVHRLAWTYDEPLGDISTVPTFAVSHLASRRVKAVLSGEGADEIFCGYTWQRDYMAARAAGDPAADDLVAYYAHSMAMGSFDRARLAGLLHPDLHAHLPDDPWWFYRSLVRPELPSLQRMQWLDIRAFMGEQVLTKVDRASMASSLEVRVPFLDPELVELLFGLDPAVYFRPGEQKPLLRGEPRGRLPEAILQRTEAGLRRSGRLLPERRLVSGAARRLPAGARRRSPGAGGRRSPRRRRPLAPLEGRGARALVPGVADVSREERFVFVVCGAAAQIETLACRAAPPAAIRRKPDRRGDRCATQCAADRRTTG